jgi:hypothetical protein
VLYGNAFLQDTTTDPVAMLCGLGNPGLGFGQTGHDVDVLQFDLQPGAFLEGERFPISLTGAITLGQADTVTLTCGSSGPSGSVSFFGADIGAIQVAAVN